MKLRTVLPAIMAGGACATGGGVGGYLLGHSEHGPSAKAISAAIDRSLYQHDQSVQQCRSLGGSGLDGACP
jgi:hypothetical protein